MKKTQFLLIFMLCFGLIVNAQKKTNTSKNKTLILKVFEECINKRNISYFDQSYTEDFTDHTAWEGEAPGREGLKASVKVFFEGYSEIKVKVEDIFEEGNKISTRESWKVIDKSGKTKTGTILHIFWIKNGKVTDEWSVGWDWLEK